MKSNRVSRIFFDLSGSSSLSSDMLTFTKITENKDSGLTFPHVFIDILLSGKGYSSRIRRFSLEKSMGSPLALFGSLD